MKRNTIPKNKIIIPPGFIKVKKLKRDSFSLAIRCKKCNGLYRYYGSAKPPKKLKCDSCKTKKNQKNTKTKPIKIRRGKK